MSVKQGRFQGTGTRQLPWRVGLLLVAMLSLVVGVQRTLGQGSQAAQKAAASSSAHGSSAAETSTVKDPKASSQGSWSAPFDIGLVGIHAALLPNGQVLFWTYYRPAGGPSPSAVWNPTTNQVTNPVLPFNADIFCSGVAMLPSGMVLVIGGNNDSLPGAGIVNATIFDSSTNQWSSAQPLNYARWYGGDVELPDGTILAVSGKNSNNTALVSQLEQYNETANTWTVLPTSANIPMGISTYPRLVLLPTGKLFDAGFEQQTFTFDPTADTWTQLGNFNIGNRTYGSAVLLPGLEKVLAAGGRQGLGPSGLATATTEIIDFSKTSPAWSYGASMNYPRENLNLVLLADGSVLVVGGNQGSDTDPQPTYANPVYQAELYNPTAGTWTVMASQSVQRSYHSTALLLPDGRVVSAGSDYGSQPTTVEIYSPPYLFKGTRPTITSSPASITYNQQFTISTPDAANIKRVALVKVESTTHATRFDARFVDLKFTAGNGTITATAPPSGNYAPPGYYMLSILNKSAVPAVMPFIQVTSN